MSLLVNTILSLYQDYFFYSQGRRVLHKATSFHSYYVTVNVIVFVESIVAHRV